MRPALFINVAKASAPSPSSKPFAGRKIFLAALIIGVGVTGLLWGGLSLRMAWNAAAVREASLPELEERGRREPFNGPVLALLAVRRCEAKQYGAAGLDFERAAGAGERGATLWRTWAAATAASGDLPKARAALELGIARDPDAAPALRDALTNLDALPPDAPPSAIADAIFADGIRQAGEYYGRGSLWNGYFSWRGRRDPAHSGFATRQEWANAEPGNPAAQRWWAEALLTNERYDEAEIILQKLVAAPTADAELYAALGDALREQNRHGESGRAYRKSMTLAKDNKRALLGMGRAALDKSLIGVSVPLFGKAARLYPESADAWIGLGRAYFQQVVNNSGAVAAFERARTLTPNRTDFFLVNAAALRGAVAAFERARTLTPNRTDFFLVNAAALRGAGRYADAEAMVRKRLAAAPDDAAAHHLLAEMILQTRPAGDSRTEAERELRESLRLADNPAVKGRLGRFLVERNRGAEAIPLLKAALSADNKDASALRALATALRQTGDMEAANQATQSLADLTAYRSQLQKWEDRQMLRPDDIEVHRALADLLERGGEAKKAAFHREAARRLQSTPGEAKRALRQINAAMSRSNGQGDG